MNQKECVPLSIDIVELNETGNGILSLNAKFEGAKANSSFVSVKINEMKEIVIWPENFSDNGYAECLFRLLRNKN